MSEKEWREPYRVSACSSDDEARTNAREAFKRQSIAVAMRSTLVIPSVYAEQRGRKETVTAEGRARELSSCLRRICVLQKASDCPQSKRKGG